MKPDLRCPACGRVPRLRAFPTLADLAKPLPPNTELHTYQCKCGLVYTVTAAAYQRAA